MRTIEELTASDEPAFPLVQEWVTASKLVVEILEPSDARADVLVGLQVTTRSPMGAIAYETGGILIDHGWLRVLGAGHPKLRRNIVDWNSGRSAGYLLVADDVLGGFFAVNGGGLGSDPGSMYYLSPDTLKWEPLSIAYSEFILWALSENLESFYDGLRWPDWKSEVAVVTGDQCFNFYPFLWTKEGSVESSSRKVISIDEQFAFNADAIKQFE